LRRERKVLFEGADIPLALEAGKKAARRLQIADMCTCK
jgi:hypothetical protein